MDDDIIAFIMNHQIYVVKGQEYRFISHINTWFCRIIALIIVYQANIKIQQIIALLIVYLLDYRATYHINDHDPNLLEDIPFNSYSCSHYTSQSIKNLSPLL